MGTRAFQCGFEFGLQELNFTALGGNAASVSSTKSRTGSFSLRSGNYGASHQQSHGRVIPASAEVRAAATFNHVGVGNSTNAGPSRLAVMFFLRKQDGTAIRFGWSGNNKLYITLDTTELASDVDTVGGWTTRNTWHDVSIAAKIHPTDGWLALWINGIEAVRYEGNTGTSEIVGVSVLGTTGANGDCAWDNYCYCDDFYVDYTPGEDMLPASSRRFLFGAADGNGQSSQMTGSDDDQTDNYQMVDDPAGSTDSDSTFVRAASAGLKDLYSITDFSIPSGWIPRALIPTAIARKTDAAVDTEVSMALYKSGDELISDPIALSTAYDMVFARFTALPDDSDIADESNVNACESGQVSAGDFS